MPTSPMNSVIEHLRRAALRDGAVLGDGELLGCFIARHDEAALAALVQRHGPMVWGVCRRLLSHHDAEDAFQATFLVLVRKAASILPRAMVGNWLYGVAHQAALQARRTAARRRAREVQVTVMPDTEAMLQNHWPDVQPLLDEELRRLPDNYRAVIVLCDLEGRTRKEVARQLSVPQGTVAGRLARARALLAKRLARQGVTLSGGALAAVLAQNVASAGVPTSVVSSTIRAASCFAAGQAAATGPFLVQVAALTEGVLKAMLVSKLKAVVAVVLVLGFLVTGAIVLTCRTAAGEENQQPPGEILVEAAQKRGQAKAGVPDQEREKEGFTAWGKEVGGLQAGLGYLPGQKRAYGHGETVTLVVRVRNVGKKEVKFAYFNEFFYENPPAVTDGKGKPVLLEGAGFTGEAKLVEVNLAPGKVVELCELNLELRPAGERDKTRSVWTLYGTGKFQLQNENIGGGNIGTGEMRFDPLLSKLATGKLELQVKDAEKLPQKQPKEKQGFTAWGKEVGGLQAGLGFRPGEKRAYGHGETVTLVVRVRNVGKEKVKFSYLQPYCEHPPTVSDSDGKSVPQPNVIPDIGERLPGVVELAPGKEIDLHELKRQLRPASESGSKKFMRPYALYGTGKVSVQYEQVLGTPEMGVPGWKLDPALGKLATGALELEVKEAERVPEKKREKQVYTPEELIRAANSLVADEKVVVQFKVRVVRPSPQTRTGVGNDDGWVAGHGPDDLGLHPQGRLDYTQEQFAAILIERAKQQLKRLGIHDVGKHFQGKSIRVTGQISSYLPLTDEPVSGRQYDLVINDVSQVQVVD